MIFKEYKIRVILLITIMLSSCDGFNKLLKSSDYDKKYEAAIDYYNKTDYFKAIQLFDELLVVFRSDMEKSENIYYYYAYCYYNQSNYILAGYYFHRFASKFPRSERAEQSYYMSAYCKYLDSPKISLDQTSTREAIMQLQSFIDVFPSSDSLSRCNELIDELRLKLETKDYEAAKLYHKTEYYQSAVYSLDAFLKKYPTSVFAQEAMFLMLDASFLYANLSVAKKKAERLQSALEVFNTFVLRFPDSEYRVQADIIGEKIKTDIAKTEE